MLIGLGVILTRLYRLCEDDSIVLSSGKVGCYICIELYGLCPHFCATVCFVDFGYGPDLGKVFPVGTQMTSRNVLNFEC